MPHLASQTETIISKSEKDVDVGKTPLFSQNDVVVGNTHLNSLIRSWGNFINSRIQRNDWIQSQHSEMELPSGRFPVNADVSSYRVRQIVCICMQICKQLFRSYSTLGPRHLTPFFYPASPRPVWRHTSVSPGHSDDPHPDF